MFVIKMSNRMDNKDKIFRNIVIIFFICALMFMAFIAQQMGCGGGL